jgi:hypothetical protein
MQMQTHSRLDHDEAVRRCALQLVATGYHVQARVEGWFEPPDYINGYRPDIVAHRGGRFIIVEVKKGGIDWPKIFALEKFVSNNHAFKIKVMTPEDILKSGGRLDLHDSK